MKKRKFDDYAKYTNALKELDIQRALLQKEVDQIVSSENFETLMKQKKMKLNSQFSTEKRKQSSISCYFKPNNTDSSSEISVSKEAISDEIGSLNSSNESPNQMVKVNGRVSPQVKCIYSSQLKKKIKEILRENSLLQTYLLCDRRIPKSTLHDWKNEGRGQLSSSKQGRKTPFRILEEELYLWFLKARARKIIISQNSMIKKALKLSKSVLMDTEVKLTPQEKDSYVKFEGSNGWYEKFRKRYKLASRFITTRCSKNAEEIKNSLNSYFTELNQIIENEKPARIYNMDEVCIFFELSTERTLEIKGKKVVGGFSTGKEKERLTLIITASSDGTLLPPFLLFKAPKPRAKTFKDHPEKETMEFNDQTTKTSIEESGLVAYRSYSGWNNKRIMEKYYVPYLKNQSVSNSLLLLDNHGSHTTDTTIKAFEENNIKYHLTPNTTSISQPVDVGIGGIIKAKIKNYFENWVIDNWESNNFYNYNEKKQKYTYKAPNKEQIAKWIIQSFQEISNEIVKKGKLITSLST